MSKLVNVLAQAGRPTTPARSRCYYLPNEAALMKTVRIVVMAWCFLSAANFAAAQSQAPTATAQVNTIFSGAEGKYEAAPDTAVLHLDISSQQDTSRAAYERVAAAADQVRDVLRKSGLDPKAAQIGFYAVQPVYDWKNPKHRVLGYRVTTSVTLKLRDFTKIGPILDQLSNIEDTQNQTMNYTLEEVDQAKAKAAEDALKKARNQAASVATAGGRSLGELLYASVDVNQPVIVPLIRPNVMARATAAAEAAPTEDFTPQNVTITAHVNAMFALK
jgi:uncharacterized protein YggE